MRGEAHRDRAADERWRMSKRRVPGAIRPPTRRNPNACARATSARRDQRVSERRVRGAPRMEANHTYRHHDQRRVLCPESISTDVLNDAYIGVFKGGRIQHPTHPTPRLQHPTPSIPTPSTARAFNAHRQHPPHATPSTRPRPIGEVEGATDDELPRERATSARRESAAHIEESRERRAGGVANRGPSPVSQRTPSTPAPPPPDRLL